MAVIGRVMAVDMTREALITTGIVMTMTMVTLLIWTCHGFVPLL